MSQLSNAAALDLIASALDRQEWNADVVTRIADIVQRTGRTVRDLDEPITVTDCYCVGHCHCVPAKAATR